ncbi:cysteine ABC transporter permease/ATP-binding protein [Niallia circulans]|uniref:thiol reductant ABC exporter subunit CydD n=1 Tax=Niallia circulans TaxID=1397 RepID=UPI00077CB605|nr:thiol reductant ABC exporter subunit CydD [Niallia circulans]MDR4318541.1 thiol reductant ABC exporter subunit CydD [Niallia circulans]MED3839630.1 thiol reductant ABC exporter subunit CydD [Niallia circulans]MED4243441.1 thiol reductant ABC exporter subunit CydD [Niallia circulans]MED4247589.1 thiol reductant ABC exporter subunit CydD [Niallia circulans]QKH62918.1 thiol reductant ABC exporter subunit CydD [Niallia circulans]
MQNIKKTVWMHKKKIYWLFGLTLILGLAIVAQAYVMTSIVDGVFLKKQSFSAIIPWLMLLLVILFVRSSTDYISKRIGVSIASKVKGETRKNLLAKYTANSVQLNEKGQTGEKVSMLLDGVDEMDSFYSQFIPQVMQSTFVPLLMLLVILTQHVNSGIILMVSAPFIPIYMIVIGIRTQKKSEEKLEKLASFSGKFLETLQGLVTLKLFAQTNRQKGELEKSSLSFRDTTLEILKIAFTQSFALELISMLSIGIVALELAIQLIIYKSISFFTAFLILILVPEFYTSLKELGVTFHNGRSSMGAAQKVLEVFEEEDEPTLWGKQTFPKWKVPPTIELHQVDFAYTTTNFRLESITATFLPNQQIAIVGASGAGKTTLLHLLAGMITPEKGTIYINQEALTKFAEAAWLERISYISQTPYIFSGTIGENIAMGTTEEVGMDAIKTAAQLAGIAPLVASLEHGFDTRIGEAGRGLSSGEKQRVSIARAFLKKPHIVLLDEPTRGLDLATEKILQQSIQKLKETATVITVAHRLHTIKNADQILFLENGRLQAVGTHESLLEISPAYKELVMIQKGREQ